MKRIVSALLSCAMVVCLLTVPTAAATTLNAYRTMENRTVILDGHPVEPEWIADIPLGTNSFIGALCDLTHLYLALDTAAATASFTVNGVTVSTRLGSSPAISVGKIAGADGVYELAIPLYALGLSSTNLGSTVTMSATAGSDRAQFNLVLGSQARKPRGANKLAGTGTVLLQNHSSSTGGNVCRIAEDGTLQFNYDGSSYMDMYSSAIAPTFCSLDLSGSFWLSFDADFNELPIRKASGRDAGQIAFFFFLSDKTSQLRYDIAFWTKKAGGTVWCAVKNGNSLADAFDTGLTEGTAAARGVKVRFVGDANGNLSLYLNGVKKNTWTGARQSNTASSQLHFYVDHRYTTENVTDVVLRNLSYREYATGSPSAIPTYTYTKTLDPGTGTGDYNAAAYVDPGSTHVNGKLEEPCWYLPGVAVTKSGSNAPAARVGFLWNKDDLLVGIQTFSGSAPESAVLTVGSKTYTANFGNYTATLGDMMYTGQQIEWAIPLSALGLSATSAAYSLTITNGTGTSGLQGTLTLSGHSVLLGDNCDAWNLRTYSRITDSSITQGTHTTLTQGKGYYHLNTASNFSGNDAYVFYQDISKPDGGYALTLDMTVTDLPCVASLEGYRGLSINVRSADDAGLPAMWLRCNLTRSSSGNTIVCTVSYDDSEIISFDTGVTVGSRLLMKFTLADDGALSVTANGTTTKLPPVNVRLFPLDGYAPNRLEIRACNYNMLGSYRINVRLHDILLSQPTYASAQARLAAALNTLSEETVLNGNAADDLKTKLNLPSSVSAPGLSAKYPVTWSVTDFNTGGHSNRINPATGQVTAGSTPAALALTATAASGTATLSKTFHFRVKGSPAAGKVAFIPGDMEPRTGVASDFTRNDQVFFDDGYNSLVFDQGSAKRFNRITLYDGDKFSRTAVNHLGVYISNDNKTYTKLSGWQLHQQGGVYTLYNLDQTARYVKVHSYQDSVDTIEWQPAFHNAIQSMMAVSYETDLLGAKGGFAHSAVIRAQNSTAALQKDAPAYITLTELGAKAGQYQPSAADFRFVSGNKLLAHWYDGKSGFFVRVPSIPANGVTEITAYWGNPAAKDISDGEATFEATYGNVISHDLTRTTALTDDGVDNAVLNKKDNGSIGQARAFTFPNGNVIAIGNCDNPNYELVYILSTDGGRTFSAPIPLILSKSEDTARYGNRRTAIGGYMWDEKLDRLWVIVYSTAGFNDSDMSKSDCRLGLFYTDDMGQTWSVGNRQFLSLATATPIADNDIIYENSIPTYTYMITYCEGLTLKDSDGAGPNVDYVICHGVQSDNNGGFQAASIYSKDGGKSWYHSDNALALPPSVTGHEYGISETGLAQLDDGTLYILARAQADDNDYLYQAWSDDFGKSWRDLGPSEVISTNTAPALLPHGENRLLMWAGNNSLGGNARQRLPISLGVSSDEYQSYDKIVNLTLGSSLDSLRDSVRRITNPSISLSPDGTEAFLCWINLRARPYVQSDGTYQYYRGSEAILVEDFDKMIYDSKGAYDDFETTALHSEGWLSDNDQTMLLSDGLAFSGERSMKLVNDAVVPTRATRMIPSVRQGNVGASLFVPSGNKAEFVMELKAGYNYTYLQHTIAAFGVKPNGDVFVGSDSGKKVVTRVALDTWNNFTVSFDMSTGRGILQVNGVAVGKLPLMDKGNEVTAIQLASLPMSSSMTKTHGSNLGSCLYVDNFYVTEANLIHNPQALAFADVSLNAWNYQAINFVLANNLMAGYNADTFAPDDTLSRSMMAQILYNHAQQPAVTGAGRFSDVAADRWYSNAVTWAAQSGLVGGYGDGSFAPDRAMTLEEAAVILWNHSGSPAAEGTGQASGGHSDWAASALSWCAEQGVLDGVPYQAVTETATRAQTAQMLMNYLIG